MDRDEFSGDIRHREVEMLLPWYLTGRLNEADRLRVVEHLAGCATCRQELGTERAIGQGVAEMPVDVDLGWAEMRRRIKDRRASLSRGASTWRWLQRPSLSGRALPLLVAAQFLLIATLAMAPTLRAPPAYRALGSAPAAAAGDAIVMFQPDFPAGEISRLLAGREARVVDGPTAAGAFVLAIPLPKRASVLAALRANGGVTLAEPIDP